MHELKIGYRYIFDTQGGDSEYKKYDGKPCTIVNIVDPKTYDFIDVGAMYKVTIEECGEVVEVFADEILPLNGMTSREKMRLYDITAEQIRRFNKFRDSSCELLSAYDLEGGFEISDLDIDTENADYPFEQSFDEINCQILGWTMEIIEALKEAYQDKTNSVYREKK
jgi:hypothetical protein